MLNCHALFFFIKIGLFAFEKGLFFVEPERIELSSREDNTVLSTCLVDFRLSGKVRQATA